MANFDVFNQGHEVVKEKGSLDRRQHRLVDHFLLAHKLAKVYCIGPSTFLFCLSMHIKHLGRVQESLME